MTFNELNKVLKVLPSLRQQKVSLKLSYKLAKGIKYIKDELEFYQEKYSLYLNEYAEKNESGNFIIDDNNGIKIQSGKEQECLEKIQELDSMEIEIPNFKFTLEELEDIQLTVEEMEALLPFIEEE